MTLLRITSRKDGFRRAGLVHGGTVDHDIANLTEQQIAALKAEPLLTVEEIDLPDPPKKTGAGK